MSTMIPYTYNRNPLFEMNRFFDDDRFFDPFAVMRGRAENFRVSVRDAGDRYEMEAELPGVNKDQLSIDVNDGRLTLSAEWNEQRENQDGYILNERRSGKMQRSFTLEGVEESAITAAYADGILHLTLPKCEKPSGSRRIEIQ